MIRECRTCGEGKELSKENFKPSGNGFTLDCRPCVRAKNQAYQKEKYRRDKAAIDKRVNESCARS